MERRGIPYDPHHLGVALGASKMIFEPMVRSTQTVDLSCIKINTDLQTDQNELSLEPRHVEVPLVVSKMIFEPMVCFAQTVHLSCTDTNTVYKQKQVRFHKNQVT
jgi:hypothetical protein